MLIAVPSDTTSGLEANVSEHFGHCAAFTLVAVEDGAPGEVTVVENTAHEQGGCMAPVELLAQHGVDTLLAGGLGMGPLAGFRQAGIEVYSAESATTVLEAVKRFVAGDCPAFDDAKTCSGAEGGCGGHHHHPQFRRVPIEGTKDIRDGRFVTLEFELKDGDGQLIDSSAQSGPMRFVFGAGQMLPGLEKAVSGLEPGGHVETEIPAAEGFGERDEARVIEVERSQLPPDAQVGAMVTAQDQQGRQFPLIIIHLDDQVARMDGNHPLAGIDLQFDVTVTDVEELEPVTAG